MEPEWLARLRRLEEQMKEGTLPWSGDGAGPQRCPSTPASEAEPSESPALSQPAGLGTDNPLLAPPPVPGSEHSGQGVRLLPSGRPWAPEVARHPSRPLPFPSFPATPSPGFPAARQGPPPPHTHTRAPAPPPPRAPPPGGPRSLRSREPALPTAPAPLPSLPCLEDKAGVLPAARGAQAGPRPPPRPALHCAGVPSAQAGPCPCPPVSCPAVSCEDATATASPPSLFSSSPPAPCEPHPRAQHGAGRCRCPWVPVSREGRGWARGRKGGLVCVDGRARGRVARVAAGPGAYPRALPGGHS